MNTKDPTKIPHRTLDVLIAVGLMVACHRVSRSETLVTETAGTVGPVPDKHISNPAPTLASPAPVDLDHNTSTVPPQGGRLRRLAARITDTTSEWTRIGWVSVTLILTGALCAFISTKFPILGLDTLIENRSELEGKSEEYVLQVAQELAFGSSVFWYLMFGGIFAMISIFSAAIQETPHFFWNKLTAVASATLVAFAGGLAVIPGLSIL